VLLAAMDSARRERYLASTGLRRLTGHTITDRAGLERHLAHVKESGIALEVNEFQDGLACLASPVRSRAGAVVGSVAISLPAPELLARRGQLERVVRHGAKVVTHAVGAASRTPGSRP